MNMNDSLSDSFMTLWSAYTDKKMELEDAQDRIEKLEEALRIADAACWNYWLWEFTNPQLLIAWRNNYNERNP